MKKNIILALSLAALSLTACSKDKDVVKPEEAKTESFQALDFQGSVADMPVVDFTEKSELRGVVGLFGQDIEKKPAVKIKLNAEEISPRWLVIGGNSGQYVTYVSSHKKTYKGNEKGQGYEVTTSSNGKQHLHMWWYYSGDWSGGNAVFKKNQFSCMYIGGHRYIPEAGTQYAGTPYNHNQRYNEANEKLVATSLGAYTTRDIPLTSKILRIRRHNDPTNGDGGAEGVNTGAITSDFKPRGCIFAFKVQNETGKKIQLVSISGINTTTYPSPLWYTGYFTVQPFYEAPLDGSVYPDAEYTIPFVGQTKNGDFPFYRDENTAGVDLTAGQTTAKRFFLWGYPVAEGSNPNSAKPLVVKVNYRFYGDDGVLQTREVFSVGQKFHAPTKSVGNNTEGWQDGWCYRATLHIKKRTGDNPLPIVEYMELKSNIIDSYDDKYSTIENEITDAN